MAASDWWTDQRGGRWVWLGGVAAPTPEQITAGTGTFSLEVPAGGAWVPDMPVRLAAMADPSVVLRGTVNSYGPDSQDVHRLEVAIDGVTGSGTYTGWRVAATGPEGATGPAGPAGYMPPEVLVKTVGDLGDLSSPGAVFDGETDEAPRVDLSQGSGRFDLGGLP